MRTEKKCRVLLSGQLINATEHAFHFGDESGKRYSGAAKIGPVNYLPIAQNNAGYLFDKYGPKSQQQLRSSIDFLVTVKQHRLVLPRRIFCTSKDNPIRFQCIGLSVHYYDKPCVIVEEAYPVVPGCSTFSV